MQGLIVQMLLFYDNTREFKEIGKICDKTTDFNEEVVSYNVALY